MAVKPQVLDRWGRPIERKALTEEIAAATLGGVRSPMPGYPGDGLNPVRLAQILRAADMGDPQQYLELAETIEERDPHYLGVISTRKRSVSQIDITVEAASDDALDIEIAEMVRDWIARDELTDEFFDILDAIGKGVSYTEILWDTSEGQWRPARLEWRDPRWFRPSRVDLRTPMMIDESGQDVPLRPGKFITASIRAKSGLPIRAGLARIAAWSWMFKAFTQRDWAIFTQTYGQPLRVGKLGPGASDADKDTLFRAVANIAGDCAAIIPESMSIDFIETKSVSASSDLYERRADWLDRQVSKAVLGQTTTTDAVSGGHAVSREHRQVQEDIERADAKALAGILNQDLVRVWVQLEYGPRPRYPRIVIARPEAEDLQQLASSLGVLVPLGLRVSESEVRDKFGLSDPQEGERLLGQPAPPPPTATPPDPRNDTPAPDETTAPALHAVQDPAPDPASVMAGTLARAAAPAMDGLIETVRATTDSAGSLDELRELILSAWPQLDTGPLAEVLAQGMAAAAAAGRVAVLDEADDDA